MSLKKGSRNRNSGEGRQLRFSEVKEPQAPKREYRPFLPGPNPELPDFLAMYSTPYDPENDKYDVPAFDRDLVVDKAHAPKAIYDMHTYWSKKHWAAIREYIKHYLPEKYYPRGSGLVLDCFSGSGMTGVAAMMEDRPCVLIDASPAAAFISHCYTHPVDPDELSAAYDRMMVEPYSGDLRRRLKEITGEDIGNLHEELDWLYATKCDRCRGDATTEYVVYSERFQCPKCLKIVALFDCPEVKVPYRIGGKSSQKTELKKRRVCPFCLAKNKNEPHRDFAISTRSRKFGSMPVLVSYKCLGGCKPSRDRRRHDEQTETRKGQYFEEHDLGKIQTIEAAKIPHWYPKRKMMDVEDDSKPWGVKWRAGTSNFRTVAELYSKRNLWALAAWRGAVSRSPEQMAALAISVTVPSITCSKMLREEKRAVQTGTYYNPPISRHISLANAIDYGKRIILSGQLALSQALRNGFCAVSNESALLAELTPNRFDYVFTDPPYLNLEVQYGELNFLWEGWLDFSSEWLASEITLNPVRGITWAMAEERLRQAILRIYHVLKPGRFASICYHDTSVANWKMLHDAILDTGFEIMAVTVLDPKQKSHRQTTAEKIVKSDLVVSCRKPRPGEATGNGNGGELGQISRRVREILIQTLSNTGGLSRDKLWDIVLKRLLTRGQMAEHRFDDLLSGVAFRSESGQWFLKEEFESVSQNDIKNEETAGDSLVRFARLRCTGVPAKVAAQIALSTTHLASDDIDESEIELYIKRVFIHDAEAEKKFKLGARMKGVEFYDCLFFYLTHFLKGRPAGKTPRRNLADFLEEYLVRFKDGDKWLYRVPDDAEAESLKKARQTGLGRRIRQFTSFLKGEGDFPAGKMPDAKTLVAWMKYCAAFGLADEGVLLFDKGGLVGQLAQLSEDDRYDAQDYYSQCRRKASKEKNEGDEDMDDLDVDDDAGEVNEE